MASENKTVDEIESELQWFMNKEKGWIEYGPKMTEFKYVKDTEDKMRKFLLAQKDIYTPTERWRLVGSKRVTKELVAKLKKKGKRVFVLGKTGAGKSTLFETACGLSPHIFPQGHDFATSETQDVRVAITSFEESMTGGTDDLVLGDTPGLSDAAGRDKVNIGQIFRACKILEFVHCFILVLNGTQGTLDADEKAAISLYREMFGSDKFFNHLEIVLTRCGPDYAEKLETQKLKDGTSNSMAKKIASMKKEMIDFGWKEPNGFHYMDLVLPPLGKPSDTKAKQEIKRMIREEARDHLVEALTKLRKNILSHGKFTTDKVKLVQKELDRAKLELEKTEMVQEEFQKATEERAERDGFFNLGKDLAQAVPLAGGVLAAGVGIGQAITNASSAKLMDLAKKAADERMAKKQKEEEDALLSS